MKTIEVSKDRLEDLKQSEKVSHSIPFTEEVLRIVKTTKQNAQ